MIKKIKEMVLGFCEMPVSVQVQMYLFLWFAISMCIGLWRDETTRVVFNGIMLLCVQINLVFIALSKKK